MPSIGLGYRFQLHDAIVERLEFIDVLEIVVDQYLSGSQAQRRRIQDLSAHVPLLCHGVGLSLGTAMPPDGAYLDAVARAIDDLGMPFYGEHLAYTGVPGYQLAELLPLPRTREAADAVIANIRHIRSIIDVPIYLENISAYYDYPQADFDEADFLNFICAETGAKILLDVENLYANAINVAREAEPIIDALAPGLVRSVHLAGGELVDGLLIDNHGHRVPDEALNLLPYVLQRHEPDSIVLERDQNLSDIAEIFDDLARIRAMCGRSRPVARDAFAS